MGLFDRIRQRLNLKSSGDGHGTEDDATLHEITFSSGAGERKDVFSEGESLAALIRIKINVPVFFDLNVVLSILRLPEETLICRDAVQRDGCNITWLPVGEHQVEWRTPALPLKQGRYLFRVDLMTGGGTQTLHSESRALEVRPSRNIEGIVAIPHEWGIRIQGSSGDSKGLSWQQGHQDWFFKHFDHAANVIIHYMFDGSTLLKGKILDMGCGEGITDLGIFLRMRPELLVGIDIEGNFRELPRIMKENGLPFSEIPEGLVFRQIDARKIPYPEDYFDVVISWALLEHVPGGYEEVLKEIKRVLKDGGLLFLHPGLYYSSFGSHLGEFSSEPFVHLTKSEEELREIVFTTEPNYIDRGGLKYKPEDFWRYYKELNRITVSEIEKKLKDLGFEFRKVAVRTEDLVVYDKPLQKYSIQDLTTRELYLSLVNRK